MSAPAIGEVACAIEVTSVAKPLTGVPSLIAGVAEDSGALCSGAVNGTTIWTTNQSAISRVSRDTVIASDTRRVPTRHCARAGSYALSVRPQTAE